MGRKTGFNYLPLGNEAEAARKIAAKNLCEWAGEHLPDIHADADEPFDVNETVGPPTASHNLLILDSDVCLGFMCPEKACVCDRCQIAKKADEILDDDEDVIIPDDPLPEIASLLSGEQMILLLVQRDWGSDTLETLYEYEYGEYLPASLARGARATAELRLFGRIRF